jgi:hypothetical protein
MRPRFRWPASHTLHPDSVSRSSGMAILGERGWIARQRPRPGPDCLIVCTRHRIQVFINTIRSDVNVSRLAVTRLQTPTTGLAYIGITDTIPCAQCAADNIAQGAPVGFFNFLTANPTLTYTVYHIPSLDTPTTTLSDLRTNPMIGDKERILRALLGGSTLNSAPGGDTPIFQPTCKT